MTFSTILGRMGERDFSIKYLLPLQISIKSSILSIFFTPLLYLSSPNDKLADNTNEKFLYNNCEIIKFY